MSAKRKLTEPINVSDEVVRNIVEKSLPGKEWALKIAFERPETCLDIILEKTQKTGNVAAQAVLALLRCVERLPNENGSRFHLADVVETGILNSLFKPTLDDHSGVAGVCMAEVLEAALASSLPLSLHHPLGIMASDDYHSRFSYTFKAIGLTLSRSWCSTGEDTLIEALSRGTQHEHAPIRLAALEGCVLATKGRDASFGNRNSLVPLVSRALKEDRSLKVRRSLQRLIDGKTKSVSPWLAQ